MDSVARIFDFLSHVLVASCAVQRGIVISLGGTCFIGHRVMRTRYSRFGLPMRASVSLDIADHRLAAIADIDILHGDALVAVLPNFV